MCKKRANSKKKSKKFSERSDLKNRTDTAQPYEWFDKAGTGLDESAGRQRERTSGAPLRVRCFFVDKKCTLVLQFER